MLSLGGALSLRVTSTEMLPVEPRTSQEIRKLELDKKTRSIVVDKELVVLVGSSISL